MALIFFTGKQIARREFLNMAALACASLGTLAFRRMFSGETDLDEQPVARVGYHRVDVREHPDEDSPSISTRRRDELINIYEEVISPAGPDYNPVWYRIWGGYIHSGRLQKVAYQYNPVAGSIAEGGQLAEVTVPLTQTMRWITARKTWEPLYRLYYESCHWVTSVEEGPDGQPWYRLHDELTEMKYLVPATHLRLIPAEEFSPISADVDPTLKKIVVSIGQQLLQAYEDKRIVLETKVSTGVGNWRDIPGKLGTETPLGEHTIQSKMPSKHMGNGGITADYEAYELPGVPWTSFFTTSGHAIHGTYWHQNFGIPMSRGCVNVPTSVAKWIFRWTTPVSAPETWEQRGRGTTVIVKG